MHRESCAKPRSTMHWAVGIASDSKRTQVGVSRSRLLDSLCRSEASVLCYRHKVAKAARRETCNNWRRSIHAFRLKRERLLASRSSTNNGSRYTIKKERIKVNNALDLLSPKRETAGRLHVTEHATRKPRPKPQVLFLSFFLSMGTLHR